MTTIDLDAYLERIAYKGDLKPDLESLAKIQLLHALAIPFENIDPFLGLPVPLDLPSLEDKLITRKRGGYCFEQNFLLKHALEKIGFKVTGVAGRVLWQKPPNSSAPATHMLLRVDIDAQTYIIDAGFGGQVLTGPLRLESDIIQMTPHEPFRLQRMPDGFILESEIRGNWQPIYYFDLSERLISDFEILNYYLSTAPQSPFVSSLMVARPDTGRRWTLSSKAFRQQQFQNASPGNSIATLAEHRLNEETVRREIVTSKDLIQVLNDIFHLTVEDPDVFIARTQIPVQQG
ncbi:MAG: arylamine N-acetyltransferase [Sneathiellales bacterium]|nr:arylamine N-acetyltransferase [Sneathiellales bacterium]